MTTVYIHHVAEQTTRRLWREAESAGWPGIAQRGPPAAAPAVLSPSGAERSGAGDPCWRTAGIETPEEGIWI